jgi:hypothetical protein
MESYLSMFPLSGSKKSSENFMALLVKGICNITFQLLNCRWNQGFVTSSALGVIKTY